MLSGVIRQLINDPDTQVLRECALLHLHHYRHRKQPNLWSKLALKHDGKDRWYLEALGIGADNQWDKFFTAYLSKIKDPLQNDGGRDIVWRARTDQAVPYIAQLATDEQGTIERTIKIFPCI